MPAGSAVNETTQTESSDPEKGFSGWTMSRSEWEPAFEVGNTWNPHREGGADTPRHDAAKCFFMKIR
jgi:hypothetical protein